MKNALAWMIILFSGILQCSAQNYGVYNPALARSFDRFYNHPLPALELETEDSLVFNTASLAGKTVYVDFWFTTCPPCLKEIPYSTALQNFFAADTNIVFLNICIENVERKKAWRDMIKAKQINGINVFYARNRPQKVNLLRTLGVDNFPTYLLVNNMKIIGHNAPAPSEKGFVQWAIYQAAQNIKVSDSYNQMMNKTGTFEAFMKLNKLY